MTGMFTSISVVPFLLGIVMIMCGSFFYDVRRAFAKADDSWGNQVARILPADGKTFIIKEGVTVREVDDRKIPTHNLSSSCVTSKLAAAAAAATQGTCTATSPPRHIYGVGMDPTGLRAMAAFALDIGTAGSVLGVKDRHTAASKAASKWLGRQKNGSDANSKLGGVSGVCKRQDRSGSTKALAEDDRARGSNTIDWPPLFVFVILTALGPASVVVESNWG